VIDLDASIVVFHSEKEQAAATFKKTFGYHPLLAFCDNTGEFLAAALRKGNAGSNTACPKPKTRQLQNLAGAGALGGAVWECCSACSSSYRCSAPRSAPVQARSPARCPTSGPTTSSSSGSRTRSRPAPGAVRPHLRRRA
jgi:hypothetical protein